MSEAVPQIARNDRHRSASLLAFPSATLTEIANSKKDSMDNQNTLSNLNMANREQGGRGGSISLAFYQWEGNGSNSHRILESSGTFYHADLGKLPQRVLQSL